MSNVLIIDFGATKVKSKVITNEGSCKDSKFVSKGSATIGAEVSAVFFSKTLSQHLIKANKKFKISAIIICCEMHGFLYKSESHYSNYYSWRYFTDNDKNIISKINKMRWYKKLNIFPRVGLPIVTLMSLANKKKLPKKIKILFIPQIICEKLGYSNHSVHATLGQASGLYNNDEDINNILHVDTSLPSTSHNNLNLLGEIKFQRQNIPVYGGYGDLQTSLYNFSNDSWNINLGTGSQIAINTTKKLKGFETRANFNNTSMQCVSHLPAGRSLELLAKYIKNVRNENNTRFFWERLRSLKFNKHYYIKKENKMDLNFFKQNRFYTDGGFIKNIKDFNLTTEKFFYDILVSMAYNYARIIETSQFKTVKIPVNIHGKLIENIPILKDILHQLTKLDVKIKNYSDDPTLVNMEKIYFENYSAL